MSVHSCMGPAVPEEYTFILLKNMGSTCFINSVLQSFFSTTIVSNFCCLYSDVTRKIENEKVFSGTPLFFFCKIYNDSQMAPQNEVFYEPNFFLDAVFSSTSAFKRNEQADSNEFILFLLNSFDNSVKKINQEIGSNELPLFSSFFLLDFKLTAAGGIPVEEAHDTFSFLSLDSVLMQDALNMWENADDLRDINVGLELKRTVTSFPPLLLLQSRIFNGLEKACLNVIPRFSIVISGKKYCLKAVIIHIGNSINEGHYVCFYEIAERWVFADDAQLRPLNDLEFHKFFETGCLPGNDSAVPYQFLFEIDD